MLLCCLGKSHVAAFPGRFESPLENEHIIRTKIKIIPDESIGEAHCEEAACAKSLQLSEKARKQNAF